MTTFVIQVDKGEEVLEKINAEIQARGVQSASMTLIGAVHESSVSVMAKDDALKDYVREYAQPFELTGTGEVVDGKAHVHVTLAGEDLIVAGHLHSATVRDFFVRAHVQSI